MPSPIILLPLRLTEFEAALPAGSSSELLRLKACVWPPIFFFLFLFLFNTGAGIQKSPGCVSVIPAP